MRLTPTHWQVLETLDEHGRLTTGIIAHEDYLDKHQSHVSDAIAQLRDYGLVEKVGPQDFRSGLYETTLNGMAACEVRDTYESGTTTKTLEELIEEWIGQ